MSFWGHPGRSVYRGLLDILDPRSGRGSVFGMTQKCDLGVRYYPAVGLSLLVIPVSIYTPLWEVQIGVFLGPKVAERPCIPKHIQVPNSTY